MPYTTNMNFFKFTILSLLTIALSIISLSSTSVKILAAKSEYTIKAGDNKPLVIYARYGSDNINMNLTNVAATAVITNPNTASTKPVFNFDVNETSDVFYGDPSNTTITPESPRDCETFVANSQEALKYKIPSSFFSDTEMRSYGLQTAKNGAQEKSTLAKNHTGCLVFKIKLNIDAKVGDRGQLVIDTNAGNSPELSSDQKPEPISIALRVVASDNNVSTSDNGPIIITSTSSAVTTTSKPTATSTSSAVTTTSKPTATSTSSKSEEVTTRTGASENITVVAVLLSGLTISLIAYRKHKLNKIKVRN